VGQSLDATTLRRLAFGLVGLYKQKGICANLVDLAKIMTTWDARCDEMIDPLCGVSHLFFTHDNESSINQSISTLSANNGIVSVAGQVTLTVARYFDALGTTPTGALPVTPAAAFMIDSLGTFACIDSIGVAGATQVITFADVDAALRREIIGIGTGGLSAFTINSIDIASFPWQFPSPLDEPTYGENAFVGLVLMDSAGDLFTVTSSEATDSAGDTVLAVEVYGGGVGNTTSGAFSIAAEFDPAGVLYAGRIPLLRAKIYTGEFSLTYDPIWDVRLKDETAIGPWSLISSFSSTLGVSWSPTPVDVVVIAQNAHEVIGQATDVYGNALTDDTQAWTPDEWRGMYLLPEWNQHKIFKILGNTATEIAVDIPPGVGDLDTVAQANSHYVVLTAKDAIRYTNLVSLLPSFIPAEIRPFIKFETV
jgi:hypothetical protein